ncbi:hypothetical protein PybrP1_003358 [[Pythium] brassicae (nom. inval.)]|nr:hypothetical protein PybrP1_003358 [[Pythium] brassicae (nom. inval.)]
MSAAASNGHVEVVRYLLENRIGLDSLRALDEAVKKGHVEIVELLCAHGFNFIAGSTAIEDAVKNDRLDTIQVLCESGIDGAVELGFWHAVKLGKIAIVKFLYELDPKRCVSDADDGNNMARIAAEKGYLDIIKFFNECGDSSIFFDSGILHCAAVHGHLDIVKYLLENHDEFYYPVTLEHALREGHHHVVAYMRASSDKQHPTSC